MDKLSGLASKLGGGSKGSSGSNESSGKEDYVDKGKFVLISFWLPTNVIQASIVLRASSAAARSTLLRCVPPTRRSPIPAASSLRRVLG